MPRFLAGLGFACITGGLTRLITPAPIWWLGVGAGTAAVVWFGAKGVEAVGKAIDSL